MGSFNGVDRQESERRGRRDPFHFGTKWTIENAAVTTAIITPAAPMPHPTICIDPCRFALYFRDVRF